MSNYRTPESQNRGHTEVRIAEVKADILHIIKTLPEEEAADKLARERVKIEQERTKDPKTGFLLIDSSSEEVGRMLAYSLRHSSPLAALGLDMDDLKGVNDSLGHEVGDKVIKVIGSLIEQRKRKEDLACKYPQGDEFFLFLPGTDLEGARELAERIRQEVPQRIRQEVPEINAHRYLKDVTISIGITTLAKNFQNAVNLRQEADQALLQAKNLGKNRVVVYEPSHGKSEAA